MPSFDIVNQPWIDVVRDDGGADVLSLRALLGEANRIARLSESSPLTEVAMLRILIALFSDGVRARVRAERDWPVFAEEVRDCLSAEVVEGVLAPFAGREDVLSSDHNGFFDGPVVRRIAGWDDPRSWQPVSRFLPELPTGTNLAHFAHVPEADSALCAGCILKGRAVDSAFARGGLGPSLSRNLLATIGGSEPRYVIPLGGTLLSTLLLNLVIGDSSRPSWVSVHRSRDGDPGAIARMSWRPRLVALVESSETGLVCARCGRSDAPRFTHTVIVDTYNHAGSEFGTKADVERWKASPRDPHLLAADNTALNLGSNPAEWPVRAITRLLGARESAYLDQLAARVGILGCRNSISVTSSAGNQAKIDDAPHASVELPAKLIEGMAERRAAIGDALSGAFARGQHVRGRGLIPTHVPRLLDALSVTDSPKKVVAEWLDSARSRGSDPLESASDCGVNDGYAVRDREAARRLVRRLHSLSREQLAALGHRGGAGRTAAWQAAFEAVWHGADLPPGSRRRCMRQALVSIGPICAMLGEDAHSSAIPFELDLARAVRAERALPESAPRVTMLLKRLVNSTSCTRDDLLLRLVRELTKSGQQHQSRAVDLQGLLFGVSQWNCQRHPTPARWKAVLRDAPQT